MKNVLTSIRVVALLGFITLCGAYLAAQSKPKQAVESAVKILAEAEEECTSCPFNTGKLNCLDCHNFTAHVPFEGCVDCVGVGELAAHRLPNQQWTGVRGSITGKAMKIVANWEAIGMPAHHRQLAIEARKTMVGCKPRTSVTQ